MLQIYFENNKLELGKLAGITLNLQSSFLEFSKLQGSYTVPFKIPRSEVNNLIFQFPYSSDLNTAVIGKAFIKHSGIVISEGELTARNYDEQSISCNYVSESGLLYSKIKGKEMPEFEYGGERPNTWGATFPLIYNEDFYSEIDSSNSLFQNNEYNSTYNYVGGFPYFTDNCISRTPCMFLWLILNKFFRHLGFTFQDDFFTNAPYNELVVYSNTNAATALHITSPVEGWNYFVQSLNIKNHVPDIPAKDFILALQNFFNIYFKVEGHHVRIIDRQSTVFSTEHIDISLIADLEYKKTILDVKSGFIMQFFRDGNDGLISEVENSEEFRTSTLNEDINFPPAEGAVDFQNMYTRKAVFENTYNATIFTFTQELRWELLSSSSSLAGFSHQYSAVTQNSIYEAERGLVIPIKMTPLIDSVTTKTAGSYSPDSDTFCFANLMGNYSSGGVNKTGFRLMLHQRINDKDVSWAGRYEPSNGQNNFAVSPQWSYLQRWKNMIQWLVEARKVQYEFEINFTLSQIKNFDFTKKYQIGTHLYFILSFSVGFTLTAVLPARCICIRV